MQEGLAPSSGHEADSCHNTTLIVIFTRDDNHNLTARRREFFPGDPASPSKAKAANVVVKQEERPTDASDAGICTHDYQYLMAGMGILMISNHPELETLVRGALSHVLLGSKPRGVPMSDGFTGKALMKVVPAVFDTDRLRVISLSPSPRV